MPRILFAQSSGKTSHLPWNSVFCLGLLWGQPALSADRTPEPQFPLALPPAVPDITAAGHPVIALDSELPIEYNLSATRTFEVAQTTEGSPDRALPPLPATPIQSPLKTTDSEVSEFSTKAALTSQSLTALANSVSRYPSFVNPTGQVRSVPVVFRPDTRGNTTSLNVQTQFNRTVLQNLSNTHFPSDQQRYWVLPGNRIVIETQGWHADASYQGRETNATIDQTMSVTQALWGLQAAWILPQSFKELISQADLNNATILSIAGEVINPSSSELPTIALNARQPQSSLATRHTIQPPPLGSGSTYSPSGGGALFDALVIGNSPQVLQAFPTHNLQALLEGGGLIEGAIIPKEILGKAGIVFGNPVTQKGFRFAPEVTSIPGIHTAQVDKFENFDLLNVLANPFLDQKTRDLYYLNALHWVSLGLRAPKILATQLEEHSKDWYRVRLSRPHQRTLLQYEKQPGLATYYNIFANPGLGISYSLHHQTLDTAQTFNASIGSLIGVVFEFLRPHRLEKSVWEARLRSQREERFTPLRSRTSPEQRKQINQRLDRTLGFTNRASQLEQVAGSITFPSPITPTTSQIWQIRAGTHERRIRFTQVEQIWQEGDTAISKLRLSNETFGPLTLIGTPIPKENTGLATSNRRSAVQTLITTQDGQRQFLLGDQIDSTVVPIGIRSFTLASDRLELTQIGHRITEVQGYDGALAVPTIEGVWSGSNGPFHYAIASGFWWNVTATTAPNLSRHQVLRPEPRLGFYTNAIAQWSTTHTQRSQTPQGESRIEAIVQQTPTIQLLWNSAVNPSNPASLNFNYAYLRQTRSSSYGISSGLFFAAHSRRLEPILYSRAQLALPIGLELSTSIELSNQFMLAIDSLQSLNNRWSIGLYGQTFQTTPGLSSRFPGLAYGITLQHRFGTHGPTLKTRIGSNRDRFELRFESTATF